jgi:2-dehydro-3-deoxyphosphooctonate aldolase (KDO 8-P synthase)
LDWSVFTIFFARGLCEMVTEPSWAGFSVAPGVEFSNDESFVLFAGPCAIESKENALKIARELQAMAVDLGVPLVFKASYDKANRTSIQGYRGLGFQKGLDVLRAVKDTLGLPIVTDVHETHQVEKVAQVADVIQIPAFLCRQTDLLLEAGNSGRPVNVKKGQFMAPHDMRHAVEKIQSTGNSKITLTERGTSFGYNNLTVDMRSLPIMRQYAPVVFDATHSVQLPGGLGDKSGGQAEYVVYLARAAAAVGVDGFFMETHFDPSISKSDGPNMIPLQVMPRLISQLLAISQLGLGEKLID